MSEEAIVNEVAEETVEEAAVETAAEATEEVAAETAKEAAAETTMDNYADQIEKDPVWEELENKMKSRTVITVEISSVVKSGVVAYIDGVRGFIPASQLSTSYVEDLESWVGKTVDVMIIEAKQADRRLILSGKRVANAKEKQERNNRIDAVEVGSVLEGTVESIQNYGAFISLEGGISGLLHISQISTRRIDKTEDVLSVGDSVTVKVIGNEKHKISLSMKALAPAAEPEEPVDENSASKEDIVRYKEKGKEKATTSLADLLKGINLD